MTTNNLAIDVLKGELANITHQISEMNKSLKAAREKQQSLNDALSILTKQPVALPPSSSPSSSPSSRTRRSVKNQILDLLSQNSKGFRSGEIANVLKEKGSKTRVSTVHTTISRMKREKIIEKRGSKWFLSNMTDHAPDRPSIAAADNTHEANPDKENPTSGEGS